LLLTGQSEKLHNALRPNFILFFYNVVLQGYNFAFKPTQAEPVPSRGMVFNA
jgi:hypothetical protein